MVEVNLEVTPTTDAQRTALAFFDSLGDVGAMNALFAEDIVWTIWGDLPFSGSHRGRDAVMNDFHAVAGSLFDADAHGVITVTGLFGQGPVVAVEFNHQNTTAIGRNYHNHYVEVFELRDNTIAAVREYCDTAHLRSACY